MAVFGGKPAFVDPLHVGRPNLGSFETFCNYAKDIFDRRWLSNNGPYVQEFDHRIADMLGAKHCVAMCNGTVALEIAIRAIGLTGEVIIPSFTFMHGPCSSVAGNNSGICDIDPQTYGVDPNRIEDMITPRTSGIIGVHLWSRPCDIQALERIASKNHLALLFDAAHAFGCSYKGRMIGNFGMAEVLSFHATKYINTFEGGAVVTNDDELATKIRLMNNFGFMGNDNVVYIGTNGKMSEISAVMGLTGLESRDKILAANQKNYIHYRENLDKIPGVSLITYDESEKCNFQYIVLEIDEKRTGLNRDMFIELLHHENVIARRYFFPGCHLMEPYRSYFPHAKLLLPNTERLANKVMCLPTGTAIGKAEILIICGLIGLAVENREKIYSHLCKG